MDRMGRRSGMKGMKMTLLFGRGRNQNHWVNHWGKIVETVVRCSKVRVRLGRTPGEATSLGG